MGELPVYEGKLPKVDPTSSTINSDIMPNVQRARGMKETYRDLSIIVASDTSLSPDVMRQANIEGLASIAEICNNLEKEHNNEMLLCKEASTLNNWELDESIEVRQDILNFARTVVGSQEGSLA